MHSCSSVMDHRFDSEQNKNKMSQLDAIASLPITVRECLRGLAAAQGYFIYKIEAKRCKSGNLSTSHEVALKTSDDKDICYFTKCMPENHASSPFFPLEGFFRNEIFVYNRLAQLFEEIQIAADVPESERFKLVKVHYTTSTCLFMENLALKGYTVPDRRTSFTFPVAKMAVEKLSKYHALNIVLAKTHPDFFRREILERKHLIDFVGLYEAGGKAELNQVIDLLKTNDAKMRVDKFVQDMMPVMMSFYGSDLEFGVLCHGDYRGQNLMILELNGELLDVMPIDYQLTHYGHPLNDLMYFIFLATDQDFRRRHLNDLKTTYYSSLKRFLRYFDVDTEAVYPEEAFEADFKDRLLLGLIQGFRLLPLMLARNDDVPEIYGEDAELNVGENDVAIKWLNGLVDDFIQWGYL